LLLLEVGVVVQTLEEAVERVDIELPQGLAVVGLLLNPL
jgi:hypothetical protein